MGKTTAKNGSGTGGNERLKSVRRNKSTSIPSHLSPEAESVTSSRLKASGSATKQPSSTKTSSTKTKSQATPNVGLSQSPSRANKTNSNKGSKTISTIKVKNLELKMKPETDNLERNNKFDKDSIEKIEMKYPEIDISSTYETIQSENGSTNSLNGSNGALEEMITNNEKGNGNGTQNGNEDSINQSMNADSFHMAEEDFALQLEVDDACGKEDRPNKPTESAETTESVEKAEPQKTQIETSSESPVKVDSTTSEQTKSEEISKNDENQEVPKIELKDMQVNLKDCLKDPELRECINNVKKRETSPKENLSPSEEKKEEDKKDEEKKSEEPKAPEYKHKDETFSQTLRTISGRRSLSRMRNMRDSPVNSSLFVNTSNISLAEDATTLDNKTPRERRAYSREAASLLNGTPIDRKRKMVHELPSSKKPKIENADSNGSFLNKSFELLKYPFSPRKPAQVSSPFNCKIEKQSIESAPVEAVDPAKKWCVLM
ncbi:probable serine/threonine-protein kinase ifkB isoform X1 [Trichogramma pretiosum]|uniref:probable serine/threonine-protein kinase ifkB isoform X1 n=1 Tax=Trichogramma pretiosum TaxID=7493 RepID=UPI0006C98BF9|nr:probable serine/threonine-protein kinase ifkB isoform X1 [Trichogramma pretiosum]